MHGNVWEWCEDVWHKNYEGAPDDGSAWVAGGSHYDRVLRGGSWCYNPGLCRSANRNYNTEDGLPDYRGFRVICGVTRTL